MPTAVSRYKTALIRGLALRGRRAERPTPEGRQCANAGRETYLASVAPKARHKADGYLQWREGISLFPRSGHRAEWNRRGAKSAGCPACHRRCIENRKILRGYNGGKGLFPEDGSCRWGEIPFPRRGLHQRSGARCAVPLRGPFGRVLGAARPRLPSFLAGPSFEVWDRADLPSAWRPPGFKLSSPITRCIWS